MKKILCAFMAMAVAISLAACGEQSREEHKKELLENMMHPENPVRVTEYSDHGISFEVPEVWQNNFLASYSQHGSGESAYESIIFSSYIGDNDAIIMMIAAFGKSQWEAIKASTEGAEELLIGTSSDGETYYTLRIEEQKFDNKDAQLIFDTIADAARTIEVKITK